MREAAIGGECSTHGSDGTLVKYLFRKNVLGDVSIYDVIMLKWNLKKYGVTIWI
jgi:hypothetical protein